MLEHQEHFKLKHEIVRLLAHRCLKIYIGYNSSNTFLDVSLNLHCGRYFECVYEIHCKLLTFVLATFQNHRHIKIRARDYFIYIYIHTEREFNIYFLFIYIIYKYIYIYICMYMRGDFMGGI